MFNLLRLLKKCFRSSAITSDLKLSFYLIIPKAGQLSLKLVDKSLSVAEKGANLLGGTAEASSESFLSRTYQTVRRVDFCIFSLNYIDLLNDVFDDKSFSSLQGFF